MSLDTLVRAWKRPRTDTELDEWQRLERSLNAQLLGDGEGPIPPFLRIGTGPSTVGREKRTDEERIRAIKTLYPGGPKSNDLLDNVHEKYVVTPLLITIGTMGLALLGAAWAGYEFYRVFARIGHKMRRPSYYNAEALRHAEILKHQRSVSHRVRHRTSFLQPPTAEDLREAWKKAHHRGAVKEKLQMGAMLATLEASVDNGLQRDLSGEIVGRNSGIKGWLAIHCSDLLPRYSTLMRYKAAADKHQAVCGYSDPCPSEALLAEPKAEDDTTITVGTVSRSGGRSGDTDTAADGDGDIAITVGMESEGRTLVLVGVKKGVREEDVKRFANYMDGCRRRARQVWEEAQRLHVLHSLQAFDDFLYAKLGLVREKRLRPSGASRKGLVPGDPKRRGCQP